MFFKISQNSKESNFVGVWKKFWKKQRAARWLTRNSDTGVVGFTTFFKTPNLNNFCKSLLTNLFHEKKPPAPTQATQRRRKDVVKTSSIWSQRRPRLIWNGSLDDSFFKTSSRRLPGDVLKTSSKRRPQDVFQETSLTLFPGDIFKTSSRRRP